MRTITRPSAAKLSWALIPILLICVLQFIFHVDSWIWLATVIASTVLYLSLLAYHCIRQKCYKQLIVNCIFGIVFVFILYMQFVYVPQKFRDPDVATVECKE